MLQAGPGRSVAGWGLRSKIRSKESLSPHRARFIAVGRASLPRNNADNLMPSSRRSVAISILHLACKWKHREVAKSGATCERYLQILLPKSLLLDDKPFPSMNAKPP